MFGWMDKLSVISFCTVKHPSVFFQQVNNLSDFIIFHGLAVQEVKVYNFILFCKKSIELFTFVVSLKMIGSFFKGGGSWEEA